MQQIFTKIKVIIRKNWFYFLSIGISILVLILNLWLWSKTYKEFTYQFLAQFQRLDKLSVFRKSYVTPNIFLMVRFLAFFFLILFLLIIFFGKAKVIFLQKKITRFLYQIGQYILRFQQIFAQLTQKEKIVLWAFFILVSFFKVYFIFNLPLHIDEAFNYAFLASKGFWVSTTYYPGPNNHILYTTIVSLFDNLDIPAVLALRLPSLLFSQLSFLFVFIFFYQKQQKFWQASLLAGIFWNIVPIAYYSLAGRGYMLSTLLSILLIWISLKMLEKPESILNHLFILTSILGFYTIPTFLYVWLSIYFFLLFKIPFKRLFILGFGTTLWTFLLYIPIIFFNGLNALIANAWVKSLTFQDWLQGFITYFINLGIFFFDFPWGFVLLILIYCTILFYIIRHTNNIEYLLLLILLLFPFFLIFVQRVLPFDRIWTYQSFLIVWVLYMGSNKIRKTVLHLLLCIVLSYSLSINNFNLYQLSLKQHDYQVLSKKIIKSNPTHIYVNEDLYFTFLNYYRITLNTQINIHSSFDKNIAYDYCIISHKIPQNIDKNLYDFIEKTAEVKIFEKKDRKNLTF